MAHGVYTVNVYGKVIDGRRHFEHKRVAARRTVYLRTCTEVVTA